MEISMVDKDGGVSMHLSIDSLDVSFLLILLLPLFKTLCSHNVSL